MALLHPGLNGPGRVQASRPSGGSDPDGRRIVRYSPSARGAADHASTWVVMAQRCSVKTEKDPHGSCSRKKPPAAPSLSGGGAEAGF